MSEAKGAYYVPDSSPWPIVGSVGLFLLLGGFALVLHDSGIGPITMGAGAVVVLVMMAGWFRDVIRESVNGLYKEQEDRSYRMGMMWFIFSEVMFFGAFFGALFYARWWSVPSLGGQFESELMTHILLWPEFNPTWPTNGPAELGGDFVPMAAWGIPAINTLILLTSGVTLTLSHWALKERHQGKTAAWLGATVLLGAVFMALQVYEYKEAYAHLGLTLNDGIYGSVFFMLTGFHGLHVTIGAIMLAVMFFRTLRGHFTPEHHFAFEASAWYWHFVDVVWLGLFVVVYWL